MYKFEIEKLEKVLATTDLKIIGVDEFESTGLIYVSFTGSNIKHISIPSTYKGNNNCINIYHGESTKNGFWWNGKISYQKLAAELLDYHNFNHVEK